MSSPAIVYTIEKINGVVQRKVTPYIQEFETFAKGRWLGRNLLEILTKEFGAHPPIYWLNSIRSGCVKVNGSKVDENYLLKNGDKFLHRTHRHEPPVFGTIELVSETETLLAVCKPSSIPMHACGAYRFNSLEYILRQEPLIANQPPLHVVHRLDKVTSGLVVLAKDKATAAVVSEEIRDKTTKKVYLARVRGRFPSADRFKILPKLEVDIISKCIENESEEKQSTSTPNSRKRSHDQCVSKEGISKLAIEDLIRFSNIGVGLETSGELQNEKVWVSCPIGVLSHRDGIHVCHPEGKPSLSQFICGGYDEETDTSLVVCIPLTGRTHQLRLHLEFLGNPIANDPCYGGELFYGNIERQSAANEHAVALQSMGYVAQSRIPHLSTTVGTEESNTSIGKTLGEIVREENETDDEYLIRTCRYCRAESTVANLEQSLHCDGIWLHAWQYSGKGWHFRAPFPDWIGPFGSGCVEDIIKYL